jgi:hypothetical protein
METTEQDYTTPPEKRNPTGKGGFGDNPQNRNPGGWNKDNSFSYQYKRFMNMTVSELEEWNKNTNKTERTIAEDLAFKRIMASRESLPDVKEITDRTEGKPKQTIDGSITGDITVALVEFIGDEPEEEDKNNTNL